MKRFLNRPSWGLLLLALAGFWGAWRLDAAASPPTRLAAWSALEAYPWIYQRRGLPDPASDTFNLILVGDVLAGRDGQTGTPLRLPPQFQAADLLVGNLEGAVAALTPTPDAAYAPYLLTAPPAAASQLASAGFDLLGLANNHALDLGASGLQATARNLERAGIGYVGAGADQRLALQPVFRQAGALRLAFLAVTALPPPALSTSTGWVPAVWQPGVTEAVRQARQQADLVIVLVHWGYEYHSFTDPAQRGMAQALVSAGADLVVGSHPHVMQGIEVLTPANRLNPQLVAYSLGNFWFPQDAAGANQGLALRVTLDSQGIRGVQALAVIAGQGVSLDSPAETRAILQRLLPPAQPAVFQCSRQSCVPVEPTDQASRQPGAGIFWSGSIDLTGDAQAELVRRESGQIIVYEHGKETWRTPPEWRILDAALGDPDGDGRNDIVLAMLKPDASGVMRSHPFIMGYRGGIYRNLWGGSAVSDPILELELGNVDDDPAQELVVLEDRDSGLQAVTVWDWHGWGFSLRWRSPEAAYQNLRLAPDPQGGPAWIVVDYAPIKG